MRPSMELLREFIWDAYQVAVMFHTDTFNVARGRVLKLRDANMGRLVGVTRHIEQDLAPQRVVEFADRGHHLKSVTAVHIKTKENGKFILFL
jgi:hypothetical protein